ncbi:MAG: hypothetical protein WB502_10025 [Thermoactinomyces sp.]
MKNWFQAHWKAVNLILGVILILLFFLILVPHFLRWVINGPWESFWPHQKTSPEVDAAFVNAIIGFMTVGVTVMVTYLINRQTIKETAKMNNETQKLMNEQLKIQEQQARSTLRDYVYQQRVEFYISFMKKIKEFNADFSVLKEEFLAEKLGVKKSNIKSITRFYKKSNTFHEKCSAIREKFGEFCELTIERALITSSRMRSVLYDFNMVCSEVNSFLEEVLDMESEISAGTQKLENVERDRKIKDLMSKWDKFYNRMNEYQSLIQNIIYLELNLNQIDQDMDSLINNSNKKKLNDLTEKAAQLRGSQFG